MVSRRELFVWLCGILLVNHIALMAVGSGLPPMAAVMDALASRSVFHYLAWLALFQLLLESDPGRDASWLDVAMAAGATLLNSLPAASMLWVAATGAGAYLLVQSGGERRIRAAGGVLVALAFNGLWGPQVFSILGEPLLRADAALVGAALSVTRDGVVWDGTVVGSTGGHSVAIYGPCSSFHNISLGLLGWLAITKLWRPGWVASDLAVATLVCLAVVLLNTGRLYLMALSPDSFVYWHEGFGASLFGWTTAAAVLAVSVWGALEGERA